MLTDGNVLVAGGGGDGLRTSELYDPATGTWALSGNLNQARVRHTATLLTSGEVLVAGGDGNNGLLDSGELYASGNTVTTLDGHGAINGQDGQAMFNFHITQSGGLPSGIFSFIDGSAGVSIPEKPWFGVLPSLVTALTSAAPAVSRMEPGVVFDVSIMDNGDSTSDTFSISLSNGYSAGGNLINGDIQIY